MARPQMIEDWPVLIAMAENWVSSGRTKSVRSLAEKFGEVLPPAGFDEVSVRLADRTKSAEREKIAKGEASRSKRLQSKFGEMIRSGDALAIGVNRELNVARYRKRTAGLPEREASESAVRWVAELLNKSAREVHDLDAEGRVRLHELLPNAYP